MAGRLAARPTEAVETTGRLRWWDGVVLSLTIPAALIATLGYSVGALGTYDAILLWGVSMAIATVANHAYAELAAMFPRKPGGIALYAAEGWRTRVPLVPPLASFGYWFAWSSSMAVYAGIIGELVVSEWFPGERWSYDLGLLEVTLPRIVAAVVLVVVWAANVLGLRPAVWVAYATAAMLLVPVVTFMVFPYLTGDWSAATFTSRLGEGGHGWGGLETALVWLYVMCWTSLGVETCATFTPEYARGARDAVRALRAAAFVSLVVFVLFPLGAVGTAGEPAVAEAPLTFYAPAFEAVVGGAAEVMVALLVGSLLLVITTSMAASSRALYGMSVDGLTIRGIDSLNRFGVPGRAITIDLVVNLALVFLLGSTLAIVATGNLGYVAAHVFALAAIVLLRHDRPDWPRPVRLSTPVLLAATALVPGLACLLVVGATAFETTGYGGRTELVVALALLAGSLLLFGYRRLVQDRRAPDEDVPRPVPGDV